MSILVATQELKDGESESKSAEPKTVKGLLSQIEEFNSSISEKQHELRSPSKGSPERPRFKQVQSDV